MSPLFPRRSPAPRPPRPPAPVELIPVPRVATLRSKLCDACRARAYVGAEINGTDLYFCAHHFARHEAPIRAAAAELLDERWALHETESKRKGANV